MIARLGNRAHWHRRWLDNRQLAERLRCLALSAQFGELDLRVGGDRASDWVTWYQRATAREIGLPSARVDAAYIGQVRDNARAMLDRQIAYLAGDARRMHRLEHRLHALGTLLFATTGVICVGFLAFEGVFHMGLSGGLEGLAHPFIIGATIASAALPAIGAAIYGIRMQGDFAGIAERNEALAAQLTTLRHVIDQDELGFDTLKRRITRATDLLTEDLANWRQTYHARPLSLPG